MLRLINVPLNDPPAWGAPQVGISRFLPHSIRIGSWLLSAMVCGLPELKSESGGIFPVIVEKEPHSVRRADCAGNGSARNGWETPTPTNTHTHTKSNTQTPLLRYSFRVWRLLLTKPGKMVHSKKKYYVRGRSTLTKRCLLWLREVHKACRKVWESTQTSLLVSTKLSGVTNVWQRWNRWVKFPSGTKD